MDKEEGGRPNGREDGKGEAVQGGSPLFLEKLEGGKGEDQQNFQYILSNGTHGSWWGSQGHGHEDWGTRARIDWPDGGQACHQSHHERVLADSGPW